ncbi:L-aspartate oxidase [Thioclava litoralis]|uniref:L-aspartate oxidase n=2 Tax=Thioclava litoralis TaxID=3076557 RepID=A0ABZ1E435_9RHOB|nr:L-aspartate oxidase [Thioclava sp. FTW29]
MTELATSRVVIIGAGLGALYAAMRLAPRPVLVISPEKLGEGASSVWAQGGVAAAMAATDSFEAHARDTEIAGAGTVVPEIAQMVTSEAARHILRLTEIGTPFDRDASGGYVMSREAAHSAARVVRVKGDQAGREIMQSLIATVRATPSIQVLEGVMAVDLHQSGDHVTGVFLTRADQPSESVLLHAPAILMAGGGSGGLFAVTTNPARIRGQVIGMAARAGAVIADAEFVQFHPTAIAVGLDPAPLATEALRGEGAVLLNNMGQRFMLDEHPDAELAPRDIVARAVYREYQAGRQPVLDTRAVLGAEIHERFPSVARACLAAGIDPALTPIPVAPAAHYHMGGIWVDRLGRSSLKGLWACGEASSTGLHGANRLASNGLLEALVYGRICADDIGKEIALCDAPEVTLDFAAGGRQPCADTIAKLRQAMTDGVGVIRDKAGLEKTISVISEMSRNEENIVFQNMLATATLIACAAHQRRESRGGHFRSDYPQPDPAQAQRSLMLLAEAEALRDRVSASLAQPA